MLESMQQTHACCLLLVIAPQNDEKVVPYHTKFFCGGRHCCRRCFQRAPATAFRISNEESTDQSNSYALDAGPQSVVSGSACDAFELSRRPLRWLLLFCRLWKQVWDVYLYWGDPALHHFVVLAFVIGNAEVILQVMGWSDSLFATA